MIVDVQPVTARHVDVYDDVVIHNDDSIVSGDISDPEFIEQLVNYKLTTKNTLTKFSQKQKTMKQSNAEPPLIIRTDPESPLEEPSDSPAPGSLADREHKKWSQSAVVMENNPYTSENVMLRKFSRNLTPFTLNTRFVILDIHKLLQ